MAALRYESGGEVRILRSGIAASLGAVTDGRRPGTFVKSTKAPRDLDLTARGVNGLT